MAQFNVNLAFNADTGRAKTQIQELQSLLNKIAYTGATGSTKGLQTDIQAAAAAAKELQFHLNNAFNTSTGNFDLSLLDRSLKTSGSNIQTLSTQLLNAGATGQQAFMKLAQSISLADQPMLRISKRMQDFATTMKNTIKWQLSSSMLHGFMGAVQSAYGYAKDLNKSLNDIRIVTGYNTDKMAQFAEQANKAAKALSTTTTDYTNASLIYFQQGLDDAEVAARTDITVKMANAVGQSAEVISEQLTAVWNNFDDGSKSLEYYADVMTALGAATASSSDEISEGLSKFAAVASSVGLSYEYATAALATLTSNTRESADVVGNALKTLFARIQGLTLGETLDDGTDLNKYSQALEKVGISVYDTNGGLKDMDNILDEMAEKWTILSDTQKVALAQTVAGVRQYNQLIALMENWNNGDSDSMIANLRTAEGSEGALQEQADIYAESWKAAEKRVKAAAEGIYQSLLDDDFFIDLNNGLADTLDGFNKFIQGAGGIKTILGSVAAIMLQMFAHKIPGALQTLQYNLTVVFKGAQSAYKTMQLEMEKATRTAFDSYRDTAGGAGIKEDSATGYAIKQANQLTIAKNKLALVSDKMSAASRQEAETTLQLIEVQQQKTVALKEQSEQLSKNIAESIKAMNSIDDYNYQSAAVAQRAMSAHLKDDNYSLGIENTPFADLEEAAINTAAIIRQKVVGALQAANVETEGLGDNFDKLAANSRTINLLSNENKVFADSFKSIKQSLSQYAQDTEMSAENFKALQQQAKGFLQLLPEGVSDLTQIRQAIGDIGQAKNIKELDSAWEKLGKTLEKVVLDSKNVGKVLRGSVDTKTIEVLNQAMVKLRNNVDLTSDEVKLLQKLFNNFNPKPTASAIQTISSAASGLGSAVMAVSQLKSIFEAIKDPNVTGWEQWSAILLGLSFAVPQIISGVTAVKNAVSGAIGIYEKYENVIKKETAASLLSAKASASEAASKAAVNVIDTTLARGKGTLKRETLAQNLAQATGIAQDKIEIMLGGKKGRMTADELKKSKQIIAAKIGEAAAQEVVTGKTKAQIVWQTILNILTQNWLAVIMVAVGIVALLAGAIDTQAEKQEAAVKATKESIAAYKEQQDAVNNLKTELESLKETIDELEAKGPLNLIEQEQLTNAQRQEANLRQQLALEEAILRTKKEQAIQDWSMRRDEFDNWMGGIDYSGITMGTYYIDPNSPNMLQSGLNQDILTQQDLDEWFRTQLEYDVKDRLGDYDKDTGTWSFSVTTEEGAVLTELDEVMAWAKRIYQNQFDEKEAVRRDLAVKNIESYQTDLEGYQLWYDSLTDEEKQTDYIQAQIKDNLTRLTAQGQFIYGNDYYSTADSLLKENGSYKQIESAIVSGKSSEDIVASLSPAFIDQLNGMGVGVDGYVSYLMNEYARYGQALENAKNPDVNLQTLMADEKWNDEYLGLLDNIVINAGDTIDDIINDLKDAYEQLPKDMSKLSSWATTYTKQMQVTKGLETGGSIELSDYQQLDEAYQKYFQRQLDGTYKLIGAAEDFQQIVHDTELDKLNIPQNASAVTSAIAEIEDATGNHDSWGQSEIDNYVASWSAQIADGMSAETASYILNQSSLGKILSEQFNINQEDFNNDSIAALQALIAAWTDASNAVNSAALAAHNLNELQKMDLSDDAMGQGLINIASGYEECADAAAEYNAIAQDTTSTQDDVRKSATKLMRSIRAAEWKKVTKACEEYIKNLNELSDPSEIEKAYSGIANTFNETFNTKITKDFVDENIKLFQAWSSASGEEANDLAQKLYYLANLSSNIENVELILTANDQQVSDTFRNIATLSDYLRDYVNSNPITVDVQGKADLTDLLAAMMESGATATDLAAALQLLGEAEVDMSGFTNWPFASSYPSTIEGMLDFAQDLGRFRGGWDVADENVPLSGLEEAFGDSKVYGTGGTASSTQYNPNTGGGGSSVKYAEKKSDFDKTRYHTLQNQLEDLQAEYDAISEAADRAFGKNKLKAIDDEIAATDDLIAKQEEYIDAIESNLGPDKAIMEEYYNDVIGGIPMAFDDLGNISNYDAIQDAMFDKYNAMAETYTTDDEEWEAFEKKYEQLEKYIEQYEETYDLLRDEEAAYQDLLNQRVDLELEKVQYKVELELEIPENEIAILEYQLGQIEDDAFKSAEAINLLTKQAEATYDQIQANKQGLNDALKLSLSMAEITQLLAGDTSVLNNQSFTSDQIDAIKEYRDNLLDLNEEFNDIRNSIEEKVMETFDAWHEKLESGISVLDHYNSVLESYKNIVDIVGGDTLGLSDQFMADLSQASVDNAIDKVNATRDAYETMLSAQKEAEVALEEARARGDEASIHMWEENLSTLTEEAQAAHEEMLSAWEEALSGIADQFEITVERVIKSFNDSIYALGGLDGLQDDFSRQQENADRMLDDYQKIYELSKLSRDINKTIDDTDNLAGKQKLKKLLGEINKLQEDGVEMSQYDLEYLQKTYDLRLAEIELEEAQRAKNTVRLSKDNEGNWSYIYTQNTDAVDAAQQKYEDALYAMQDLSSNYIDEMSEQLIATSQEMAEALAAIRIQDFASIDDYYAEVERVQAQYQDQLSMQQDELQKAIDNNKILYDEDWTNYHNATGYKISDTENFATVFKDTLLGTLIGSEEDAANFTDIIGSAVSDLTTNLMTGAEVYYQNLEAAMNAAGTSTGDFAEDTATNIDAVVEKSKEGAAAVDQMAQEMEEAFNHITDTIVNWQETYGSAMQEIINSNMAVIESFNEMLKALSIDADSITVKYDIANAAGAKAEQFDTGGYTGDWGSDGRLAVVHEKELILNPGDTANFLSAIQITRTMLETIDLNARQASFGLGNLVPTTIKDDNKQMLEQEVHITAEFPNVSDHNEIEEAFNNLINTASQYANRK